VFGLSLSVRGKAALIVKTALADTPVPVPEIVEVVSVPTLIVVTVKVAEVAPPAIVTVAGTVALLLEDLRDTTNPPVGAAEEIVAVPVELDPPVTVVGFRLIVIVSGVIVKVAVKVAPP
jgi:hypothetical protein